MHTEVDIQEYGNVSKVLGRYPNSSTELTSGVECSSDEGELKSEDESALEGSGSSEEGEILSEVDEADVTIERPPKKDETAWERGLRLARERSEKVKAVKASEKDIMEKRMTLSVPVSVIEPEFEETAKEDIFWPYYYKASIIGRTELTCRRYIPEDLQPPFATELAEWRLSLSDSRRTTRGRHGRRRNRSHRASSESASSVSSSASRASVSSDSDSSSIASSLASVAASWKATCAKAMKDYLSSPIRNKDRRRTGRYHNRRGSGSESSDSNSRSSDSASASDRSRDGRKGNRSRYRTGGGPNNSRSGYNRPDQKVARSKRSQSDSDQSGSASRSRSQSGSAASSTRGKKSGHSAEVLNVAQEGWRDYSGSPDERRTEVLPLPHERPVKRPWAAAPELAQDTAVTTTTKPQRDRSRSTSRSHSDSSPTGEERRFITSWSKSPSPTQQRRPKPRNVHRQRLPDVVPGNHMVHVARADNSEWQRDSRTAHVQINRQASGGDLSSSALDGHPLSSRAAAAAEEEHREFATPQQPASEASLRHVPSDQRSTPHVQSTPGGGELPHNRPGVKLTLAPRLKASAVDMTNLSGVSRGSVNRPASPPPRLPRLPFPLSLQNHGASPITSSQRPVEGPKPLTADQEEIRRQAEVVAKVVEARERRRAYAEAAERRRNPKMKKKDDLSDIPVRGRPTYRRVSFSDSSVSSASSRSQSRSPSAETPTLQEPILQRSQKPRKNVRAQVQFDYGRRGTDTVVETYDYQNRRNTFQDVPPPPRKVQARSKPQYENPMRSMRPNRQLRYDQVPPEKQLYMDYAPATRVADPPRYRDMKPNFNQLYSGSGAAYMDEQPPIQQRYNMGNRRREIHHPQPPSFERSGRPRTPHADADQHYIMRSPHAMEQQQQQQVTSRVGRRRLEDRSLLPGLAEPRRKRTMIVEPHHIEPPSTNESTFHYGGGGRSRHRSRGPGALIDRSEPFESDAAGGGYASEQRLRQLRERLNLVDDAIAELKSGSNVGYGMDTRR